MPTRRPLVTESRSGTSAWAIEAEACCAPELGAESCCLPPTVATAFDELDSVVAQHLTASTGVEALLQKLAIDTNGDLVVMGANLVMDTNEIQARNSGNAASVFLNAEGGNIGLGNSASRVRVLSSMVRWPVPSPSPSSVCNSPR